MRIAVVGEGTSRAITDHSPLAIAFVPSTATGVVLAAELPAARKGERVLYAASDKAGTDIQVRTTIFIRFAQQVAECQYCLIGINKLKVYSRVGFRVLGFQGYMV